LPSASRMAAAASMVTLTSATPSGIPRPARRRRSSSRPFSSRLITVDSGTPEQRAASSRLFPSRQHRMSGARNLSATRPSSSSNTRWRSRTLISASGSSDTRLGQPLARGAPARGPLRLQGQLIGGSVQPIGNRLSPRRALRLPGEQQERRLTHVLRILVVVQDAQGDANHHRRMPPDQHGECAFVALLHEVNQQIAVGSVLVTLAVRERANHVADGRLLPGSHVAPPRASPIWKARPKRDGSGIVTFLERIALQASRGRSERASRTGIGGPTGDCRRS
jgi:hypothetical protein